MRTKAVSALFASLPVPTRSRAAATVAIPAPDTEGSGTRTTSGSLSVGRSLPRAVAGKTMSQLISVFPAANRSASERRVANTSGEVATTVSSAPRLRAPCLRARRTQTDESVIQPSGRSGRTPTRSPMSVRSTGAGGCSTTWTLTHLPSTPASVALNRSAASITGGAMSTAAATRTMSGSRGEHAPPVPRTYSTAPPAMTTGTVSAATAARRLTRHRNRLSSRSTGELAR